MTRKEKELRLKELTRFMADTKSRINIKQQEYASSQNVLLAYQNEFITITTSLTK